MSFSYFRDKPRLSDRMRGKSGDELFKELRKELDQDRKMFFDNPHSGSSPAGSTFPRAGHMFHDDLMRGNLRSHLDDIAARHPEFADHLNPWGNEMQSNTWGRKRRGSGQADNIDSNKHQQQEQKQHSDAVEQDEKSEEPGPLRGRPRENLPQYGLRNTVPDMGQKQQEGDDKESRGQRSWSAPPDNRTQPQEKPQRFVSKIEITPVNPNTSTQSGDASKPPPQPQPQPTQKQSNVRHIPIFVEGRDEPVLPRNVEQEFTQTQAPPHYHSQPQPQPSQFHSQPHAQQFSKPQSQPFSSQEQFESQAPKKQEPKQEPTLNLRDPLVKVQLVQGEVDELKTHVENFKGTSRSDKDYIYLDEMLTRNLIKLDDIETEGKENVRAARKEAIKSIQRCISILENKVPTNMEPVLTTTDDKPEEPTKEMDVQKEETPKPEKELSVDKQMDVEKQTESEKPMDLEPTDQQVGEKPMEVDPKTTVQNETT